MESFGTLSPVEGLVVELGANESMRLPTFVELYYSSPVHVSNSRLSLSVRLPIGC